MDLQINNLRRSYDFIWGERAKVMLQAIPLISFPSAISLALAAAASSTNSTIAIPFDFPFDLCSRNWIFLVLPAISPKAVRKSFSFVHHAKFETKREHCVES